MKNKNRIKKICIWVDALEFYKDPDEIIVDNLDNILKAICSDNLSVLDYEVNPISKDEAETFELE